jgi:hypothetical protein
MMNMWKDMTTMMLLMFIKKKLKDTKVSLYLMGRESHNQVLQRNAFRNQNVSLKDKKGVNNLVHVSLKQIEMLMTFDKYKLQLLYDNNHYMYIYIHLEICSQRD